MSVSITIGTKTNGNRPCNNKGCKTCRHIKTTDTFMLSLENPTRCAHLPPVSQRVWSTWLSVRNATNITSVQQKMSCTSASMATDMTSETWRYRNQWLNTSINVDTPWKKTVPLRSLKRSQRVEESVKHMNRTGMGHFIYFGSSWNELLADTAT